MLLNVVDYTYLNALGMRNNTDKMESMPNITTIIDVVHVTEQSVQNVQKPYQVPVSKEMINIMLFGIMIIALLGVIIGIICRKDVGGIKTKCCRTRISDAKDQVHPTEDIPLSKLV